MDRHTGRLRFAVLLAGITIMGAGVALFKLSLMGNDPCTALTIAIGDRLGVDFSLVLLVTNCLWFLLEWRFGKELVGVGTFVNWALVGPLASLCERAVGPGQSPGGLGRSPTPPYLYIKNVPEWDVFIHLLEKRAQCAQTAPPVFYSPGGAAVSYDWVISKLRSL